MTEASARGDGAAERPFEALTWSALAEAPTLAAFAQGWLTLVCRPMPDLERALMLLGDPDSGRYEPMAHWSRAGTGEDERRLCVERLALLAEQTLTRQLPVAEGLSTPGASGGPEATFLVFLRRGPSGLVL